MFTAENMQRLKHIILQRHSSSILISNKIFAYSQLNMAFLCDRQIQTFYFYFQVFVFPWLDVDKLIIIKNLKDEFK